MAPHVNLMLLAILTLFGTSVQQSMVCPDGFNTFQNACYRFVRDTVSWDMANTRCADMGAILAEPDNQEKIQHMRRIAGIWPTWLGATDRQTEGAWIWSGSGRPMNSSLWLPGQPDSYQGRDEDCLVTQSGGLFDASCTATNRPYICEAQFSDVTGQFDLIKCPDGWYKFQNICYSDTIDWADWEAANTGCAEQDAILAEPDTREKIYFVKQIIGWWTVWLGCSDRLTEGTWIWSAYNRSIDSSLWKPGQPESYFEDSDCLAMSSNGLYDAPCERMYLYVCEKQASA